MFKVKPVPGERLPELLRLMPKAELHIHIEGSLEPELMFALAQRNGLPMAYPDVASLRRAYVYMQLRLGHKSQQLRQTRGRDRFNFEHAHTFSIRPGAASIGGRCQAQAPCNAPRIKRNKRPACRVPGSAGTAPSRRNKKHSSRRVLASVQRGTARTRKTTGRRRSAWSQS